MELRKIEGEHGLLKPFTSVYIPSSEDIASKSKDIKKYYKHVRREIATYKQIYNKDAQDSSEDARAWEYKIKMRCTLATMAVNAAFVGAKAYAAFESDSVAIFTSMIDNVMDLLCNILLLIINLIINKPLPYKYRHGRSRLEPITVVLLSAIMAMAGVMMIEKAIDDIVTDIKGEDVLEPSVDTVSIVLLVGTFAIKICMWLYMRRINQATVVALSMDHRNDSLVNLVALAAGLLGAELPDILNKAGWKSWESWKFIDPAGGILIAVYVIITWSHLGYGSMLSAAGYSAPPKLERQVVWSLLSHRADSTVYIRSVTTTSIGDRYDVFVEVSATLSPNQTAKTLKDSLQDRITMLDFVENVHVSLTLLDDAYYDGVSADLTDIDTNDYSKKSKFLEYDTPSYSDIASIESDMNVGEQISGGVLRMDSHANLVDMEEDTASDYGNEMIRAARKNTGAYEAQL